MSGSSQTLIPSISRTIGIMPGERYTITVSDVPFRFTRDQLESEPGNYFATYFFGRFQESSIGVKELVLEKNPLLFQHIQTHLQGYEVFPIPGASLPTYMDEGTALRNLRADADFFGLESLTKLVDGEIQRKVMTICPTARFNTVEGLRYRVWFHRNSVGPRGGWVSDGAPFPRRQYTLLSREALADFRGKYIKLGFDCLDCLKLTEGWSFVAAYSSTVDQSLVHFVLELQ